MEYTVIKLKAMKSGTRMAFIHEGKVKSYRRLLIKYLTAAGRNPYTLSEDWVNIVDIEIFKSLKEAKKSIKDYDSGK